MKILIIADILHSLKLLVAIAPGGQFVAKLYAGFKLSLILAPTTLLLGVQHWIGENALYVDIMMLAILGDWILGTIKHCFWQRDFDWKHNIKGLLVKIILVIVVGGVYEGLDHLTRGLSDAATYAIIILRLTVFLYPATSIIRSARVISDGKFPPQGIYDKIEKWTDHLGNKK